jgi:hypothetical protein
VPGVQPGTWSPSLRISEHRDTCRLSLDGQVHGQGATLQEAADDLVQRLLTAVMAWRSGSRFALGPATGAPDLAWWQFLHELGEIAASGQDIRPRVFGSPTRAPH